MISAFKPLDRRLAKIAVDLSRDAVYRAVGDRLKACMIARAVLEMQREQADETQEIGKWNAMYEALSRHLLPHYWTE